MAGNSVSNADLQAALGALADPVPPPGLAEATLARIAEEENRMRVFGMNSHQWVGVGAGLALTVVMVEAVIAWYLVLGWN
jgi:hypothetical protein